MNLRIIIIICFLAVSIVAICQTETNINTTDQKGMKQGHWIKKYPNNNIMYDGFFKDNHPVGVFKRYYDNKTLMSVLNYSPDGNETEATIYHTNGYLASRGKYVNQLKEGIWKFYSKIFEGYLICEEQYNKNIKNGLSLKFYPDSILAEKVTYINDVKEGEWIQYYANHKICLKSAYLNGTINGKFEIWFENGAIELSGQYKKDIRDGIWYFYKNDGSVRYKIEYHDGITKDRQLDIDESNYLDSLEKNKGKIDDPEKSGVIK